MRGRQEGREGFSRSLTFVVVADCEVKSPVVVVM